MKKSITIIFLLLSVGGEINGQIPQPNTYISDNLLNKYQGTWRWVLNSDTVVIKIAKVIHTYKTPQQSTDDWLAGCHLYIRNGQLAESSMSKYDSVVNVTERVGTIHGWSNTATDTIKVEGILRDITKHKKGKLFLEYVSGTPPQLIWHLENTPGLTVTLPGEQPFDFEFTLPKDIVLTKIQ